ncbi:MAG: hypothetical protein LQ340_001073 [Diploschistes diacapsis]|nr:MAG: hypothetical protein LQ340_001073 [Diploschistes diacapsis]
MDPGPASPNQEGPSEAPPSLPEGWLAQWDIPTQPALSVPTPEPTPQAQSPFQKPDAPPYEGADRSLLGNLAMNALTGGKHSSKSQSGLESLASSFLGGQHHSSSNQGGTGGTGGIAGQLIGSFLGGSGKPQGQTPQDSATGFAATSGQHNSSGFSGAAASLFGGNHGTSSQNSYGYTSSGHTGNSGYTASAPPTSYNPSNQNHYQHGQNQSAQQPLQSSTSSYSSQQYQQPTLGQSYGSSSPNQWDSSSSAPYGQQSKPYAQHNQQMYGQQPVEYNVPNQASLADQNFNPSPSGLQPRYQNSPYQSQYNQYPSAPSQSQSQYNQYPSPPQHTQSFPAPPGQGSSQNPYSSSPPPPMNSRPSAQTTGGGQGPPYAGHGYPGQQSFGQGSQAHGYPNSAQDSRYGQGGNQYAAYGAPPPPAWR